MAFHRQVYCSPHDDLFANFSGRHPELEAIQLQAQRRQEAGEQSRTVDWIVKYAQRKKDSACTIADTVVDLLGRDGTSIKHWAIRIDDQYFDLHVIAAYPGAEFVQRTWDEEKVRKITSLKCGIGHTFMTDEEILHIGNHYIECWRKEYTVLTNNCQSLLDAVCRACLVDYDERLMADWSGSKFYALSNVAMKPTVRTVMSALGCPKESYDDWDTAFQDWYMGAIGANSTNRFGPFLDLKTALRDSDDPFVTLEEQFLRRFLHNSERTTSLLARFPFLRTDSENDTYATNLKDQSQKWTNRLTMGLIPVQSLLSAGGLLRDAAALAVQHTGTIRGSLARRTEAKGKFPILKSAVKGMYTFVKGDPGDTLQSLEGFARQITGVLQVLSAFWRGKASIREVTERWTMVMMSGDVSWQDCQTALTKWKAPKEKESYVVTVKDQFARRLVTGVFIVLLTQLSAMTLEALYEQRGGAVSGSTYGSFAAADGSLE